MISNYEKDMFCERIQEKMHESIFTLLSNSKRVYEYIEYVDGNPLIYTLNFGTSENRYIVIELKKFLDLCHFNNIRTYKQKKETFRNQNHDITVIDLKQCKIYLIDAKKTRDSGTPTEVLAQVNDGQKYIEFIFFNIDKELNFKDFNIVKMRWLLESKSFNSKPRKENHDEIYTFSGKSNSIGLLDKYT